MCLMYSHSVGTSTFVLMQTMQVASEPQCGAEAEGLPEPLLTTKAQRRQRQEAQASAKALRGMSASACTLLLARHGETEWNAAHRCAAWAVLLP